ncbi:extracellular catalytic domain type 1 short-chain-length polyhydroxyalkanoate depolymerase [Paraburkholderia hayleyella]|uniref:extracellular catalytic domain type 1 short-chain-length polyhydroxyalkanoate depolymerase n=1 Tax=Paraburkholderia hayleyella TaxID=2152889 RepID=UPI0012923D19|nr:PHB depolymerase family esterase [Paraburkholderia hayleyella]
MVKSLTKFWMGSLRRLLDIQANSAHAATPPSSPHRAPGQPAASPPPMAPEAYESRVRPRAAAWAGGVWTCARHPVSPAPGRLVNHLQYGLYLPAGHTQAGRPLLVMLHGCNQSIDEFAEGTRMNLLADRFGFAVAYPEQSQQAHPHRCWHWYGTGDHAGVTEAQAVVSLVDALLAEYGFDSERVYVAGLSAGAGLATQLALHDPRRFAALALHSGPAFGEARSGIAAMDVMRRGLRHEPVALLDQALDVAAYPGMPALIIQGDADSVVAPVNARQLAAAFAYLNHLPAASVVHESREAGVSVTWHDYRRAGQAVVRLCEVSGLGHAWSGGDDTVPFHSASGPDASALIWDFLSQARRLPEA